MSAILWVGMDVHKDFNVIAVFEGASPQPMLVERVPNEPHAMRRFLQRLAKRGRIRACYEASGAGYVLQRMFAGWGIECEVIAPGLIPQRRSERRKHDKHDATQLARLYRAGELTPVRIPSELEERVRDLVRCRETFQREIIKSRHYILKFLRRRGFIFREGEHWTIRHFEWLRRLHAGGELAPEDQVVFGEYLALLEYKLGRRDELDRQIEAHALTPAYRTTVAALRCFRAIDTHCAMVLATEIGDWRRFENPRQLMAYLGLVPSEYSSGDRHAHGPITKAGNTRCRHALVQAAWNYRHRPGVGISLKARQQGQPASVIAHTWKAQHRIYKLFHRIAAKRPPQIAAVAAARELVGFVWAVMQMDLCEPTVTLTRKRNAPAKRATRTRRLQTT
jgi:transposase